MSVLMVGTYLHESMDALIGIPQGSVLESVLFLVYVNYLTQDLVFQFGAFVNDYKIYLHYMSGKQVLREDWHYRGIWIEFLLWQTIAI